MPSLPLLPSTRSTRPVAATFLLAAVVLLAPAVVAQPAVQVGFLPTAPTPQDVILVTLTQEGIGCPLQPQAVTPVADGLRIQLLNPAGPPAPGSPTVYPCSAPWLSGPTAAFIAPEPGVWRVEVVDGNGMPVAAGMVAVSGDPATLLQGDLDLEALPSSAAALAIHAEGSWPHSGLPHYGSILRDGHVLSVRLEGEGDGAAVISSWDFDTTLGGLDPGVYSVILQALEPGDPPSYVQLAADYAVVSGCNGGFGIFDQLCLHHGRFRVRAYYRVQGDEEKMARPRNLTNESGAFWFFRADNLELLVKVLDGCSAFDRYWVFVAGLTNVGVRLEVTDTWADETWTYSTEPGEGFDEVRDTNAFATCDAAAPAI